MKEKKRYRKGKGMRKRKELIVTCDVTQEIRKQLNRLWNTVRKISFRAHIFNIINNYEWSEHNSSINPL